LKSVDQQPRGAEDLVEENPRPAAAIGRIDVATVFFRGHSKLQLRRAKGPERYIFFGVPRATDVANFRL